MIFLYQKLLILVSCMVTLDYISADGEFTLPKTVKLMADDSFFYECELKPGQNIANVSWYFINTPMTDYVLPNNSIYVKKVDMGLTGLWECRINNRRVSMVILVVRSKPFGMVMKATPGGTVPVGTLVEFLCEAAGTLPISYEWFENGRRVTTDDRGTRLSSDLTSIWLRVNHTTNVKCNATNNYGSTIKRATVFVGSDGSSPTSRTTAQPSTTATNPKNHVNVSRLTSTPTTRNHVNVSRLTSTPTTRAPLVCSTYTGSACQQWLSSSHQWASDPASRLPSSQEGRERLALSLLHAVDNVTSDPERSAGCAIGLKALFCGKIFPACTRAGDGRHQEGGLCSEHCKAVYQLFCPKMAAKKFYAAIRVVVAANSQLLSLVPMLKTGSDACSGLRQMSRLRASTAAVVKPFGPPCTAVQLERPSKPGGPTPCYDGHGENYRGTESSFRFRVGRKTSLQPCAAWNSSKAVSVLSREGYSLAAFPSLNIAGQSCRNPAGLKPWPFCVPQNPTVERLMPCAILSCKKYIDVKKPSDRVLIFGLKLTWNNMFVSTGIVAFVIIVLIGFTIYCCRCRHYLGNQRSRFLRSKKKRYDQTNNMPMGRSSVSASVVSDFDVVDQKSSLLTPNQDYHGKALTEFITPKLQKLECPRSDIVDIKELGRGAFGEVYLVMAKPRPTSSSSEIGEERVRMAMKVLKSDATPDMQIQFLREASLLADFDHDNIVRLMGISLIYKPFCMLMEYMCHGDLNSYLRRHDPNNTAMRVDIDQAAIDMHTTSCNGYVGGHSPATQPVPGPSVRDELTRIVLCDMALKIVDGMIYLSHQNYVHRDLATRNCLLDINKSVKIADFGLCRHIKRGEDFIDDDHGAMPVRWMPLEAIIERRFNLDTDVWSFGILLWELFSYALQPYYGKTHEEVVDFLQKGSVLDKPPDAPDGVYVLMLRCWSRQRRERPTFAFLKRQLSELRRRWTTVEAGHPVT